MLKRARIIGYKSLWDAEITFADPLTLIIGPNAAGKTNLFDALALLSRIVTLGSVKKAFQYHRGSYLEAFSFGEEGLAGNLKNTPREMRFEIDVELSQDVIERIIRATSRVDQKRQPQLADPLPYITERNWRYNLLIKNDGDGRELTIIDETLQAINSEGTVRTPPSQIVDRSRNVPFHVIDNAPTSIIFSTPDLAKDSLFWGSNFTSPALFSFPTIAAFRNELAQWQLYDLDPKQMKQPGTYIETPTLPTDGSDLASFFDTMKAHNPRQFAQMYRELHMIIPQIEAFDVTVNERAQVDLAVREHGALFAANLLSEGTLRVLGLLAASSPMAPVSLIGLEEPENGIHPRRLALVAEHLRNVAQRRGDHQQMLLTTHSPLLPGYFAPEQVVVCQRQGNRTTFTPLREAGLFSLDDLDAPPDENGLTPTPLSERIVRGDYGG